MTPSKPAAKSPMPNDTGSPVPESSFNISNDETIRRLRQKGQPITLFGESDKERRLRLRALELLEEKGHDRQAGQNDFKKALEDVENVERQMKDRQVQEEQGKEKGKKKDSDASLGTDVRGVELFVDVIEVRVHLFQPTTSRKIYKQRNGSAYYGLWLSAGITESHKAADGLCYFATKRPAVRV